MRLGVDLRVLVRGTLTGVEEYTLELLQALLALPDGPAITGFYNAWRRAPVPRELSGHPKLSLRIGSVPNRLFAISSTFLNRPQLDQWLGGAEIVWSPHFLAAAVSPRARRVITFHDLSFERYPEFFPRRRRLWHWSQKPRQQAQAASRLIAVSHSTKADLVNLYRVAPDKVAVVHSGLASHFRPLDPADPQVVSVRKRYELTRPFVLFLGTLEPRKNVSGLIRAFDSLVRSGPETFRDLELVLAGTLGWYAGGIFAAARASPVRRRIRFLGFVPPEHKAALYSAATVFVYPSFFEGFGFPPLEAMACGTPTICSHVASLPEVVGDGALMVDPWRQDELKCAMELVLVDSHRAQELRRRGLAQAKKFSWPRAAAATLRVFEETL
ncbi:glycosyltransferase family 4 protein [Candidatus Parcubacteria bacterium]|nr:glycosyltransferase family 4 protein [Candidatus Parcubacteria bacterium]